MGWIGTIIGLIIVGLVAGFIARAVVPGKQAMGVGQTILLGIVGSFVGGLLGYLIHAGRSGSLIQPSSWIGSIIGAIIVLVIYLQVNKRRARA